MEFEEFKVLEDKITMVLEKVETLKQENTDLKNRLEKLQDEYNEKAATYEQVSLELKKARENSRDLEKEEKIKQRVSGLLDKLENF
jgi:predicted nuclease with TOPRIM domain